MTAGTIERSGISKIIMKYIQYIVDWFLDVHTFVRQCPKIHSKAIKQLWSGASAVEFIEVNGVTGIRDRLKGVDQTTPNGAQAMTGWHGSDLTGSPPVKRSY